MAGWMVPHLGSRDLSACRGLPRCTRSVSRIYHCLRFPSLLAVHSVRDVESTAVVLSSCGSEVETSSIMHGTSRASRVSLVVCVSFSMFQYERWNINELAGQFGPTSHPTGVRDATRDSSSCGEVTHWTRRRYSTGTFFSVFFSPAVW